MSWYFGVLRNYAVFSGRARRREYWMFILISWLISIALTLIDFAVWKGEGDTLAGLYGLCVLIPTIAVGVRRLHDTDRCGWWIIVPLVNLFFLVQDSQPGDNQYGPNPKFVG